MKRMFDWPSLMALGLHRLGLPPEVFWGLTPLELTIMAGGISGTAPVLTRSKLNELCAQYPDNLE